MGSVAKSYIWKGFLIYEEMRKNLTIHDEAIGQWLCNWSLLNFLIYEENLIFFFISVSLWLAAQGSFIVPYKTSMGYRFVPISRTVRRTHRRPVLTIKQLASLTTIFVSLLLACSLSASLSPLTP